MTCDRWTFAVGAVYFKEFQGQLVIRS